RFSLIFTLKTSERNSSTVSDPRYSAVISHFHLWAQLVADQHLHSSTAFDIRQAFRQRIGNRYWSMTPLVILLRKLMTVFDSSPIFGDDEVNCLCYSNRPGHYCVTGVGSSGGSPSSIVALLMIVSPALLADSYLVKTIERVLVSVIEPATGCQLSIFQY
ncbi:hypothetical protein, partial [Enterococcus mundtii]|uniref:hypothetical protein n=1 Tax=Enterococcus mundtii TaxID=53346 RepID=UPI0035C75688